MFMRSQRSIPDDEKTRFIGSPVWAIGGLWRTRISEGKTRGAGHSAPGQTAGVAAIVYAAALDGEKTRAGAAACASTSAVAAAGDGDANRGAHPHPGAAPTGAGARTSTPTCHHYSTAARLLIGETMTTPNIPGGTATPAKTGRKTADQQPKRDHRAAVQAHKLRMNLAITALRFGKYEPVMKPRSPMILYASAIIAGISIVACIGGAKLMQMF